jgi:hypothetical protein
MIFMRFRGPQALMDTSVYQEFPPKRLRDPFENVTSAVVECPTSGEYGFRQMAKQFTPGRDNGLPVNRAPAGGGRDGFGNP